jgi:hypothetical protein
MTDVTRLLTYADYAAMPDDGRRYELHAGQLYASHAVPYCWIADPDARTIEAYLLDAAAYRLDARLAGTEPRALPPFSDLALDPAALWR